MDMRINIEITRLLDIREEWVKAYFLDMIARYASKKAKEGLTNDEEFLLELARGKIVEAYMLNLLHDAQIKQTKLRVIKGGLFNQDKQEKTHLDIHT